MINKTDSALNKEEALQRIKLFFQMDKALVEKEFGRAFYQYYQRYFRDNARLTGMFNESKHMLDVTGAKGKKVLDLGCGFGLTAMQLKIFGCNEVVGIDINKEKIEIFQKLLSKVASFNEGIMPIIGDGSKIDCEDKSFDVVIAREVISHVRDLEAFFLDIKRVLRKDGVLYIKDCNNALDVRGRLSRRKFWKKCEFGPVNDTALKKSYRAIREDMIKEKHPRLEPNILELLVKKTAGMWGEEIYEAVEEFCKSGRILKAKGFKYRNPQTGEYPELEFNPYYLRGLLEKNGFKACLIRPFYSYTYSGLKGYFFQTIGCLISLFHPVSLLIAPTFEIAAYKK